MPVQPSAVPTIHTQRNLLALGTRPEESHRVQITQHIIISLAHWTVRRLKVQDMAECTYLGV